MTHIHDVDTKAADTATNPNCIMSPSYSPNEKKYSLPTPLSPCYPKSAATLEEGTSSQEPPTSPAPEIDDYLNALPQSRKNVLAILFILAKFVPMISFGASMSGGLHIASSLGVTESSQASWIAAFYLLTAGAFMLMSGRLGSIYGHARNLLLGAPWWVVWSFINRFCTNFMAFNIARGISVVGGAMVVLKAVAIIGTTFPLGRMRNRCLGLFGVGAPDGGWAGALVAGLLAERVPFK